MLPRGIETLVALHLLECFRTQRMDSQVNLSMNGRIILLYKLLTYFYGKVAS
jgi:hypothetical protein